MTPRIQGKTLTSDDIGRPVVYRDPFAPKTEQGALSSFRDDGAIFVRFKGPNGERCPPERLAWVTAGDTAELPPGRYETIYHSGGIVSVKEIKE